MRRWASVGLLLAQRRHRHALQSQNTVGNILCSKQILPFGFTRQLLTSPPFITVCLTHVTEIALI